MSSLLSASRRILNAIFPRFGEKPAAVLSPAYMENLETRRLLSAAFQAFLSIPSETSEVQTSGFEGQFVVNSFNLKASAGATPSVPNTYSDIVITKNVDSATPYLLSKLDLLNGEGGLGTFQLTVVKANTSAGLKSVLQISLDRLTVDDDQIVFAANGRTQEQITLSYQDIDVVHVPTGLHARIATHSVLESLSTSPAAAVPAGSDQVFIGLPGLHSTVTTKGLVNQILANSSTLEYQSNSTKHTEHFVASDLETIPQVFKDAGVNLAKTSATYVTPANGVETTNFTLNMSRSIITGDQISYSSGTSPIETVDLTFTKQTISFPPTPAAAVKVAVNNIPTPAAPALASRSNDLWTQIDQPTSDVLH